MRSSKPKVSKLSQDIALVKDLTAILNASLDIAGEAPNSKSRLGLALANKALSVSNLASTATQSKNLEVANFAVGQTLKSLVFLKIVGMTPMRATVYMSLTMAEKVISVAGMGNIDKCKMAIASLTATSGMAGFVCIGTGTFTLGIGCIAGALSIASEAFNVYGQCHQQ